MASFKEHLFLKGNRGKLGVLAKFGVALRPTAHVLPKDGDYQMDLSFEDRYARFNGGRGVLLNVVHSASRYLFSFLLRSKADAADAVIELFERDDMIKVERIAYDAGTEFVNRRLTAFFRERGVDVMVVNKDADKRVYGVAPNGVLSIVERLNGTVRMLIERYIAWAQKAGVNKGSSLYRYENAYSELVEAYNDRVHGTIGISPKDAYVVLGKVVRGVALDEHERNLLSIFNSKMERLKSAKEDLYLRIKRKFKVGSYVRVRVGSSGWLEKGARPKFGDESWRVTGVDGLFVELEHDGKTRRVLYHAVVPSERVEAAVAATTVAPKVSLKTLRTAARVERAERAEAIDRSNIVSNTRVRRAKKVLDL